MPNMNKIKLLLCCLFAVHLHCYNESRRSHTTIRPTLTRSKPDDPMCSHPYELDVQRDISYSADGKKCNQLDFYAPRDAGEKPKPLVIFLHPGVFIWGDKGDYLVSKVCDDFARCGISAAALNYTLLQDLPETASILENLSDFENPVKSQLYDAVRDAFTAIRYFKANSSLYNIDPNQIFLTGYSAGAIIALNVAFLDKNETHFYFTKNVTDDKDECLNCLPYFGENETTDDASVAGVVAINGAVFDHRIIDDDDKTPILLIHSQGDNVIPSGVGHAYAKLADKDLELDLPSILFELGISRTTQKEEIERLEVEGFKPKILIPKWLPMLANNFVTPEVYGSKAIYDEIGPRSPRKIFTLNGGHNFVVDPETGMFNAAYDKVRKEMKKFIESLLSSSETPKRRSRNR